MLDLILELTFGTLARTVAASDGSTLQALVVEAKSTVGRPGVSA